MSVTKKAIYGLNAENYPRRMGQSWKDGETVQLLNEIRNKLTIEKIAAIHERTVGGITAKLGMLAADYHFYDGRPHEQIMKFTGLTHLQVNIAIDQRKAKLFIAEKRKEMREKNKRASINPESMLSNIMEAIQDIQARLSSLEKTKVYVVKFTHKPL
jgi:hypothetical protein